MSDTSNSFILELSSYTQPSIIEDSRNAWVEYGEDNNYYSWLIERYRNSPTNNAVINNMSKLIYGKGLNAKDGNRKPNEYAQMKMLFGKTCLRSVILDLKLMGSGAFQCVKSKGLISKVEHLPMNLLRPAKCNTYGVIEGYWYSDNWEDVKKFVPRFIPCLGTSTEDIEVLVFGNYSVGRKYFSSVDYEGALDYCVLEERIAEYLINEVENGFSGTKVVNFNNGVPGEEQQRLQSSKVLNKLTGSRGQKVIVSFNNNETQKTTVDDIPLNDAPSHYEYLSSEAEGKILAGHNVISSMLVGISKEGQGFSDNGNEIETASLYFANAIVSHFQELVIDACDTILAVNGIYLDLYFERKNMLEDNVAVDTSSSQVINGINSLSPLVANKVLESMTPNEIRALVGLAPEQGGSSLDTAVAMSEQDELEGYELIDSQRVDYDTEDELDAQLELLNAPKEETILSKIVNFLKTSTGVANTTRNSEQDTVLFKTRYRYSGGLSEDSREFCVKMVNANKLYRKEDIEAMSSQVVNEGWGPEGADTYDVFLYKGGGDCHHFWTRETYRRKGTDIMSPNKVQVTPAQARKEGEILPTNPSKVYQKPVDMPYNGFLPTNKRFN
jgi:hypothetical protein